MVVSVCCVCVRQSRASDEGGTREPPETRTRDGGRKVAVEVRWKCGCGVFGLARCSVALEKDPCERFKSGPPSDSSNLLPAIFPWRRTSSSLQRPFSCPSRQYHKSQPIDPPRTSASNSGILFVSRPLIYFDFLTFVRLRRVDQRLRAFSQKKVPT